MKNKTFIFWFNFPYLSGDLNLDVDKISVLYNGRVGEVIYPKKEQINAEKHPDFSFLNMMKNSIARDTQSTEIIFDQEQFFKLVG